MGFGYMAALRVSTDRYNISQRSINLIVNPGYRIYFHLNIFDQYQSRLT
jgi:hypothetical protein